MKSQLQRPAELKNSNFNAIKYCDGDRDADHTGCATPSVESATALRVSPGTRARGGSAGTHITLALAQAQAQAQARAQYQSPPPVAGSEDRLRDDAGLPQPQP